MKKIIFALTISIMCFFIFSCLSHRELIQRDLQASNIRFIGSHSDELIKIKGSPDFREELSNGDEVWTYRRNKTGANRGTIITIGNAGNKEQRTVAWTESINFIIGQDGIVRDMRIDVE